MGEARGVKVPEPESWSPESESKDGKGDRLSSPRDLSCVNASPFGPVVRFAGCSWLCRPQVPDDLLWRIAIVGTSSEPATPDNVADAQRLCSEFVIAAFILAEEVGELVTKSPARAMEMVLRVIPELVSFYDSTGTVPAEASAFAGRRLARLRGA